VRTALQKRIGGYRKDLPHSGDKRIDLGEGETPLSYIRGKHSFKFGGEFRRFYNNNFNGDTGTLAFNSVTDFAAGLANAFAISQGSLPSRISTGELGFFGQDSWKVSRGLTVTWGARLSIFPGLPSCTSAW
jgi:outer membrane receptor protein involved in Fe transport